MSSTDLKSDPLVDGSVAAVRKTLQRLVNRGVVEVTTRSTPTGPINLYSALRAWGESVGVGQDAENPDHHSNQGWDTGTEKEKCPTPSSSAGAGSDTVGTLDVYPRAREERTSTEIAKLSDEAWNAWD